MFCFKNKVVIVTGSGSKKGIGRTTALMFGKMGAHVVVADLKWEGVKQTVEMISKNGSGFGVTLDVTDNISVSNMVAEVLNRYGRIDVLINNAGISQKMLVQDMTVEDMKKIFEVNVFGLFRCTKAALLPMIEQKYGRIVNLSSVAGKRGGGFFGGAHYSASKAAVLGFSKNLAREVAKYNITVNSVAPGLVDTDIWKSLSKETGDTLIDTIPMKRPARTEEIGAAILFLASEEASFITGEDIDINGGSHMD